MKINKTIQTDKSDRYNIIVIIGLIFYNLLDLFLQGEGVWDREVGESDRQGEVQTLFFRIKSVV